jgi:MoxR-like ATPase
MIQILNSLKSPLPNLIEGLRTFLIQQKEMQQFNIKKSLSSSKYATPKSFSIDEDKWIHLLRNFIKGINTLITGETGTGKTTLVTLIAATENAKVLKLDMGAAGDAIPYLLGQQILTVEDGKSMTEYRESELTLFIRKANENPNKKFVVLFDEINRSPHGATNILFPLLDDSRTLKNNYTPEFATITKVEHNNIWFVATANVGSQYSGTNAFDDALKSRFFRVPLKDLDVLELKFRAESVYGLTSETARKVSKLIDGVNKKVLAGELTTRLSYRDFQNLCEMLADGYETAFAVNLLFESVLDSQEELINLKVLANNLLNGK